MIREIQHEGKPLYFLADGMGQVWLGGWWSREVAEDRLAQAEACDWEPNGMDCAVDVEMLDSDGRLLIGNT